MADNHNGFPTSKDLITKKNTSKVHPVNWTLVFSDVVKLTNDKKQHDTIYVTIFL